MKAIAELTLGVLLSLFIVWVMWWAVKTLSYKIWYQEMVREEILKMVKPECLIDGSVTIEMVPGSTIQTQ